MISSKSRKRPANHTQRVEHIRLKIPSEFSGGNMNRKTLDDWRHLIEQQKTSGLSIAAFCKANKLSTSNFYKYRAKLQETEQTPKLIKLQSKAVTKHDSEPTSKHIWAPELHKINGVWYVYFAALQVDDIWRINIYALSNQSDDPTLGEWKEEGRIDTGWENFALDATVFEHNSKHYMIWAQSNKDWTYNSALWLVPMTSPTSIDTNNVIQLTQPTFDWETVGYKVNEGPSVIKRNGKIFVTYSASATDHNYAVGLLWMDLSDSIMNPSAWNKSPNPVFYTNKKMNRFGPGHNGFTVAEDGLTDVMVYHARNTLELQGTPLSDPNRHTRVRILEWDENGFPKFNQDFGD